MYRSLAARLPLQTRRGRSWPVLRAPRELLARVWGNRRSRVALICATLAVPLLAGGFLWFRSSSFAAVRRVNVSGVQGAQAGAIESALRSAAHGMSTLAVNLAALRAAVAPFAVVREVRASTSFPHTLNVRVIEQPPVAALLAAGTRTAVAADGVVLGPALLSPGLPTVSASFGPAAGQSVTEAHVREALTVLGVAPHALAAEVAKAYVGKEGLTLAMRNGLLVYFGDATRPHAKWRALETLLTDEGSTGAGYVDVRLPERPAAGGFPTGAPPLAHNTSEATSAGAVTGQSSVEAIAEALRANTGVASGAPATGTEHSEEPQAPSTGGEAAAPPATGGEEAATPSPPTSGAEVSETSGAASGEAAQATGGAGAPASGG